MVLIEAQVPRTVALGILLSYYLDFIQILPYFRFRSVLPNLQASSGEISEALRATQRQMYWRYIESVIGARSISALKGEAGRLRCANRRSAANSQRQYLDFRGFFIFASLCLLAEYESQRQQYWRSIRETKGQAKWGHHFAALRLLLQNSPVNFALLTGNGNTFNMRRRRIKISK